MSYRSIAKTDIGKRVLLSSHSSGYGFNDFTEATVLEIAKAGMVKLQYESGNTLWSRKDYYYVVEVLPAIKTKKKAKSQ